MLLTHMHTDTGLSSLMLQAAGFFPADDQMGCVLCDPQAGSDDTYSSGYSEHSAWEASTLGANGKCSCAGPSTGRVMALMSSGGRRYSRCVVCPSGTTADTNSGSCLPGSGPPRTADGDLSYVVTALNAKGAGINPTTATQVRATSCALCK